MSITSVLEVTEESEDKSLEEEQESEEESSDEETDAEEEEQKEPSVKEEDDEGYYGKDGNFYSDYTEYVEANKRFNNNRLKDLGLIDLTGAISSQQKATKKVSKKRPRPSLEQASTPPRRSKRTPIPILVVKEEPEAPPPAKKRLKRNMKKTKKQDAAAAAKVRKLRDKYQEVMQNDPSWFQEFQQYWKGKLSPNNFKTICRQVRKLASGEGITYKHWPPHVTFPAAVNGATPVVDLSSNFEELYQQAGDYENMYGKDKGHGWLVRIPLKKMMCFQQYYLEKKELQQEGGNHSGDDDDDGEEKTRLPQRFALGTRFLKEFETFGVFQGVLTSYDGRYYHAVYEDGDEEQLDDDELAELKITYAPSSARGTNMQSTTEIAAAESTKKKRQRKKNQASVLKYPLGTPVSKLFDGYGVFKGKVISYDNDSRYYRVLYEDDDYEDYTEAELAKYVVKKKRGRPRKVQPPTLSKEHSSGSDTQTTVMEDDDEASLGILGRLEEAGYGKEDEEDESSESSRAIDDDVDALPPSVMLNQADDIEALDFDLGLGV